MAEVMSMVDIWAKAGLMGIDVDSLNLDSIQLPPDYNYDVLSDDEDLNSEDGLDIDEDLSNIIVVDNLPVVPPVKNEKLLDCIRKIFLMVGVIKEDGIFMPTDETTGYTLGFCFIEYNTRQEAEQALEKLQNFEFGTNRYLSVKFFTDIDKFMNVSEEWSPPQTYGPKENLQQWLTDEKARDQFVIRSGSDTEVMWNDAKYLKPDPVYKHSNWTDSFVRWTPLGSSLATVHMKGAAIWGGATAFNRIIDYEHLQVKHIDFSPGERYLVTYSSHEPNSPWENNAVILNIFDVRTGKMMRDFKGSADEFVWPVFRWSGGKEDKYFARIAKNKIYVYETETFYLIDKKSIKVENVTDFSWSPADPIIALFVPELSGGNQPARVSLIQIPSKVELRQKNLFGVSDCKMYWQSNGDYLAVHVNRYTKTKKSTYSGFELFRIREREIPIEILELENKSDKIIAFAWEPKGQRFAVIHGDSPMTDISFYTMRNTNGRVSMLTTLKGKQANALFWSPCGSFIVLAGLKGFNGQLEFFNVDELATMTIAEHYMATDIEWAPSGRYVATYVSSVREMENGVNIWSFYGKLLYQIQKDHLFQFIWRPRPPSLLSAEEEEEIAKNLKKCSKKYEAEDQDVSLFLSKQEREKRKALEDEWVKWVNEWRLLQEEEKLEREKLIDREASEEKEEYEAMESEVEELIDVSEEVLSF